MSFPLPARALSEYLLNESAGYMARGMYTHAFVLLSKGFALEPEGAFFRPLADLCRLMRYWNALALACNKRLSSSPEDSWVWFHLAAADLNSLRFAKAVEHLIEALRRDSSFIAAWLELGNTWKRMGEIQRAISCYRQVVMLGDPTGFAADNLLFSYIFSDRHTPEYMAHAHREWGRQYNLMFPEAMVLPADEGLIRVGYLSSDFREHSVTCFLEPVLQGHDRNTFEIFCYQCNRDDDSVTRRLKGYRANWRTISELEDSEAASLIRQDGVHILVELAGHTAGNRLPLMALKPAPVQMTWLGYPHSTGLDAIDFRIVDSVTDPESVAEGLHSEHLLRLPPPFLCYCPPEEMPPVEPQPLGLYPEGLVFACFNRIDKASPTVLALWRSILEQVDGSCLMLKSELFADPVAAERFAARSGLPKERLLLLGRTSDRQSHYRLYNKADIALDTFPYNGTTTTCEALWMGLPVITLAGRHHAARVGKTLLESVGLADLVADSGEEYVKLACSLAKNTVRRRHLRASLRDIVAGSTLCDAARFVSCLEQAYLTVLQPCRV